MAIYTLAMTNANNTSTVGDEREKKREIRTNIFVVLMQTVCLVDAIEDEDKRRRREKKREEKKREKNIRGLRTPIHRVQRSI